jgi:hypothetical protein
MVIDQRNAGASVTNTASVTYTLDRWVYQAAQASKFTVQQNAGSVTPPVGFSNYLGVTSSSAYTVLTGDYFNISQLIEGFNFADCKLTFEPLALKIVLNAGSNFNTQLLLDDANVKAFLNIGGTGFQATEFVCTIGDVTGHNNNTFIEIDDDNQLINFKTNTGRYNFYNLPAYQDNADAIANGLVVGDIYRHSNGDTDQLNIVH